MRSIKRSLELFERAKKVIPGCAQTFSKGYTQYVQGVAPIFLEHGKGAYVWDVDGNKYVDFVQGLLPNILGYAHPRINAVVSAQLDRGHSFSLPHPLELELAEKLCEIIPCAEMVRFGKNGSDATSGAIRVARGFTGRDIIACCGYHGWQDWFIGSTSRNKGVPEAVQNLVKPFLYNDIDSLNIIFSQNPGSVAAVIMEPVTFFEPKPGFLEEVKALAHSHGAILIFDEICTGWHLGLGGAQKRFGVVPDLACFGKAMGNGFPISAIVGRRDIMKLFEDVFVSFTFAGEVSAMAASLEVISIMETNDVVTSLARNGQVLKDAVNRIAYECGYSERIKCIGFPEWSLLKFLDEEGRDSLDMKSYFQQEIVKRGLLLLGTHNMNYALTEQDVQETVAVYKEVIPLVVQASKAGSIDARMEGSKIEAVFRVR
jgi:glutamate-1-semialdehyde 2,1-aminomutase/spore coat polysaccharide biosynthesis protein SpsF